MGEAQLLKSPYNELLINYQTSRFEPQAKVESRWVPPRASCPSSHPYPASLCIGVFLVIESNSFSCWELVCLEEANPGELVVLEMLIVERKSSASLD